MKPPLVNLVSCPFFLKPRSLNQIFLVSASSLFITFSARCDNISTTPLKFRLANEDKLLYVNKNSILILDGYRCQ